MALDFSGGGAAGSLATIHKRYLDFIGLLSMSCPTKRNLSSYTESSHPGAKHSGGVYLKLEEQAPLGEP